MFSAIADGRVTVNYPLENEQLVNTTPFILQMRINL